MLALLRRRAIIQQALRKVPSPPRRWAHADIRKAPGTEAPKDFRPPWVYSLSRLATYGLIPAVGAYAVFVYDWGDHEHVFMPPRRWLAMAKSNFFELSPEEERMLNAEIIEQRVQRLPPGTKLNLNSPQINPPRH